VSFNLILTTKFICKLLLNVFFSLLVVCAVSCNLQQPKSGCEKFRNGEFHIKAKAGIPGYMLVRHDSIQYETNKETDHVVTYKIKWTAPCEYELRFSSEAGIDTVYTKNNNLRDLINSVEQSVRDSIMQSPRKVYIVSSGENYYVFNLKSMESDFIITDTIWFNPQALGQ
jgi:hypothetical protein